MKTIKLKFVDFWPDFNINDNIFLDYLKQSFDVKISNNPDYIIYSLFGQEYLNYDCIRIFYSGENFRPDFNLCDYALGFDWMTFEDRYCRLPVYMLYKSDLAKARVKHHVTIGDLSKKQKFCNFIYSNSKAHPARKEFFELMNTYKKVDSGGRYLNNLGYSVGDKYDFQVKYKFSIAFENSSTSGYTTEKIIQSFAAKTIPIYWGNPNIGKEFNTNAFINCHDYASFSDVLKRVIEVDTNDDLFHNMLKAPIYEPGKYSDTLCAANLGSFLDNIFRQELSAAGRRSKGVHTVFYEKLWFTFIKSMRR